MNIQIFGTNKSFDTKKAQRWFKERGSIGLIVNMIEKPPDGVATTQYNQGMYHDTFCQSDAVANDPQTQNTRQMAG